MRVAAIDIGTNTVLLLIAELRNSAQARRVEDSTPGESDPAPESPTECDGVWTLDPVLDRARITRLGEGVDRTRRLAPAAIERTLNSLEEYAVAIRAHSVGRIGVVGTSALRDAQGSDYFLEAAHAILGVRPEVIDGVEEAELTFHGALSGLKIRGDLWVFDVGGGSTEVISGRVLEAPSLVLARSLEIGSVRLFERWVHHDPPTADDLANVAREVDSVLEQMPRPKAGSRLLGVAGTVTTLAAIHQGISEYEGSRVHGLVLTREQVESISLRLSRLTLEQRCRVAGLESKRADVIPVGAEIVRRILAWSGASELLVSNRGVRWGLAERLASVPGNRNRSQAP